MKAWLLNVAIAADQLVNAALAGAPDETLSSRAHRMRAKGHRWWGWTAAFIDTLFFFDPGHCEKAYQSERLRLQMPKDARD